MNRVCSIFSQLLKLFPRTIFEAAVREHKAERHARGFHCWDQFVAMLYCQLGRAQSLREICGGLAATEGKLKHLGVRCRPTRSTLAYANEHRPWQLYETVFHQLFAQCQQHSRGHKFRFRNKLVSLDATSIDLCVSLFDWAKYKRTKGAVKLHLMLDHDGYLPQFALITDGKTSDIGVARRLEFAPDTVVVMDRAYSDLAWWAQLTQQQVYFVTRLKADLRYKVVESRPVPLHRPDILSDEVIEFTKLDTPPTRYRRIVLRVEQEDGTLKYLVFLTNHMHWSPATIAAVYQDRWRIESFFKSIKQFLSKLLSACLPTP